MIHSENIREAKAKIAVILSAILYLAFEESRQTPQYF
jgi:hypothetical protein